MHFWHTRWRHHETAAPEHMKAWERAAIALLWLLHGHGLIALMHREAGIYFSFAIALSLMLWLAVLIYWLESFKARMEGLQPLVLPLAAVCAVLPAVFPQTHLVANPEAIGFRFHFLTAMLAYSLLTLAALHAIFMGYAEQKLHARSLTRFLLSLPPLMSMETLLFRMLALGFSLLTIAVGSGLFYAEAIFGTPLRFDHKTTFSLLSWAIFGLLLLGRHYLGWRGRLALRWTLTGFGTLLLAYIGSRFVLEVLLSRA